MTREEVISKIQDETLNVLKTGSRADEIKRYIELWEKYKGEIDG